MSYCGLTIGIQLKEIQMVSDLYVPQTYKILGGTGLDLCIQENETEFTAIVALNGSPMDVPMDIRENVEHLLLEHECSFVILKDDDFDEEFGK